ncbi:hypothetical protein NLI96_g8345 [Meripilus lineatus]|uniref:Uncharacterized protein n=1 Tax=Meripilus lineatus TaxID=2056292 RepID=A0AAD5UXH9_9APHY|nr:hypothetical protein NLI96_g8345 [Physisporinus lineatus]
MSSITATTSYLESEPTLPPTRNHLDSEQRSRLIRSTRKLGAVLGTTPQLAEPESFLFLEPDDTAALKRIKSSRRNASVFARPAPKDFYASSSSNSSSASLTLPPSRSSIDVLPTPKSFSSRPRRPSDRRIPQSTLSRTNSTHNVLLSPITPRDFPTPVTPVFPTPAEVRRKKMAKLTRTLGENIPAELVFAGGRHHVSPLDQYPAQSQRMRTISLDYSDNPDLPPTFSRSSRIWVTGTSQWRGEWNRKDIREVQSQLRNLRGK